MPERVVLDCMLFLQAITNDEGPAFRCFTLAESGEYEIFASPAILAEVEDVLSRPMLRTKFPSLTSVSVHRFMAKFRSIAHLTLDPPKFFPLPRDEKDEPYTDLAIAVRANYLVTWNHRHLTYLMNQDTAEGKNFCERFPFITILSLSDFLRILDQRLRRE